MNKKKQYINILIGALSSWVLIIVIILFIGYIVIHQIMDILGV